MNVGVVCALKRPNITKLHRLNSIMRVRAFDREEEESKSYVGCRQGSIVDDAHVVEIGKCEEVRIVIDTNLLWYR